MEYSKICKGPHGLIAKVKVLDPKTGLYFEVPIYPEEITTDTFAWTSQTSMSFSPITVPELKDWKVECKDRYAKTIGLLRELDNVAIKKIIFSGPCTIVLWVDGTKTIAKVSEGDEFDPEKGVAVCFMKKILGHTEANKILRKAHDQYWDEQDEKGNVIDQIKEYLNGAAKGDKHV